MASWASRKALEIAQRWTPGSGYTTDLYEAIREAVEEAARRCDEYAQEFAVTSHAKMVIEHCAELVRAMLTEDSRGDGEGGDQLGQSTGAQEAMSHIEEWALRMSNPGATVWLISDRGEVAGISVSAYVTLSKESLEGVQVRLSAESAADLARKIRDRT